MLDKAYGSFPGLKGSAVSAGCPDLKQFFHVFGAEGPAIDTEITDESPEGLVFGWYGDVPACDIQSFGHYIGYSLVPFEPAIEIQAGLFRMAIDYGNQMIPGFGRK